MDNNNSNKPITMVREELINKVVNAINESGLSYFVLEYIFKDLLNEIHAGAQKQAQLEQENYNKELAARTTQEE